MAHLPEWRTSSRSARLLAEGCGQSGQVGADSAPVLAPTVFRVVMVSSMDQPLTPVYRFRLSFQRRREAA
ncbi:hypothetical protein ACF1FX_36115 [Streptomyces sp. NPDC014646]|uniref:hypothetical protein n=1 Tax=unclassified Streptomyces TaxID=2593676 RepID=UPI0036FC3309